MCGSGPHKEKSNSLCGTLCFKRYVIQFVSLKLMILQQFSETSTSSTFSSSNAAGNSVISTSSILKYSEINVSTAFSGQTHGTSPIPISTITERTNSYLTPSTTVFYTYPASTISTFSNGRMFSRPTPTPNLGFIYISHCY